MTMTATIFESDYHRGKREGYRLGQRDFQDRAVALLAAYATTYPGDPVVADELWGAVMRLRDMDIESGK